MKELLEKLLFMGFTKQQAHGAYKILWRGGMVLFVLTSLGLATPYVASFAREDFVQAEIKKQKEPVVAELQSIKVLVADQSATQKEFLAQGIASQIRTMAKRRCPPSTDSAKELANAEIVKLQLQYKKLLNDTYDIPECSVL